MVAYWLGRPTMANLKVTQPGATSDAQWVITVSIADPVTFRASGRGGTIDEAASEVVTQLETVGVQL